MGSSRLKPLDAAYLFESRLGPHLDRVGFWVFDNRTHTLPTRAAIDAHLRDRAPFIATLNRRIVEIPAHLDYPYWVVGGPLGEQVRHHDPAGLDWDAFSEVVADLAATEMDPRTHAWRIHVFHGVRGVPGTLGPATIIVLQGSHALVAGPSIAAVAFALFGDPHEPLQVPGIEPAGERVDRYRVAWRGLISAPLALVRYLRLMRDELRRARTDAPPGPAAEGRTATVLNRTAGRRRVARVLLLDVATLKRKDLSLTTVLLTAVSVALQQYLDECHGGCPGDLATVVTIALKTAPETLGVNRLAGAVVDLHPTIDDLPTRAAAIGTSLKEARTRHSDDRSADSIRIVNALPSVLYPLVSRSARRHARAARSRGTVRAHTLVSSIDVGGPVALELLGAPLVFSAAYPPLTAEVGLTHCLIGAGDRSSLAVLASPDTVPEIDRYTALLESALSTVSEGLAPR